jgi:hypothetical protein
MEREKSSGRVHARFDLHFLSLEAQWQGHDRRYPPAQT